MRTEENQRFPYRYELHCHTNWCSRCARVAPVELAQAYWEKGYAGMVVTDHFLLGSSCVDQSLPWAEKMARYNAPQEEINRWARETGRDFQAFFGLEHHYGDGKEVLVYGVGPSFLLEHPDLHLLSLPEFTAEVRKAGGLISMAHPYREEPYINPAVGPRPECLDGAEVYNAGNRTDRENRRALELAREHGLLFTSGGDVHSVRDEGLGQAGIALRERARSSGDIVRALKSRDYRLVVKGELTPPC